jgi:hypothetical protein
MCGVFGQVANLRECCRPWLAAALLFSCGGAIADAGNDPPAAAIALVRGPVPDARFEVRGLPPEIVGALRTLGPRDSRWPTIFSVHVVTAATGNQPPMLGTYEATGDGLRFRPRFPLERGTEYRAVFAWPMLDGSHSALTPAKATLRIEKTFAIPAGPAGPPVRVVAIYPSAREIPENLLRCYVQFSAPMSQGNAYVHLHLRDETSGTDVVEPFLELPQELWSPDGKRLTLLLEPGRVKHDLVPRDQLGPILVAGRSYTFSIDADWPDAEGRPLAAAGRKSFRAVKADARPLDPKTWTIEAPQAGTRTPLSVRFPKSLDHAMLGRVLRVLGPESVQSAAEASPELAGTIRVTDEETRWSFEPTQPWTAGRYVLAVSTQLEDPAGNNIGRPFEVDLKRPPAAANAPALVRLEFHVRSADQPRVR